MEIALWIVGGLLVLWVVIFFVGRHYFPPDR